MNSKLMSLRKWRRVDIRRTHPGSYDQQCCSAWAQLPRIVEEEEKEEEEFIPKDVPKGHLVVYVGEAYKRFVIKVSLLKHPLFKALLDQAQDGCDFTPHCKLWIPSHENIFHEVVRCITNTRSDRRISNFLRL